MAEYGVYFFGSAAFSFFLSEYVYLCESVCKPVWRGVVFNLFVSDVDE